MGINSDFTAVHIKFEFDDKFLLLEVSHNLGITIHGVRHGDFLAVHSEVDEFPAAVGRDGHVDLVTIVIRILLLDFSGTSAFRLNDSSNLI